MNAWLVFGIIAAYFFILMLISHFTAKNANSSTFYTANRKSPWYLVAFGMIGASLSGVTFISVPGWVGTTGFTYFQMVLGYMVGYFVIATVLLPLYYKLNLVTIYTYLKQRIGINAYKTGSAYFLLSRVIGASFRLFLVATVLQIAFFDKFNIPFYITVITIILLIYLYTFKAGIKTIVWTDTLQTFFMVSAVVVTIFIVMRHLNLDFGQMIDTVKNHKYSKMFVWDFKSDLNFFKRFVAGAFIAIVMTGLDQDMMQKNLTCKNLKEAQKNVFWFSLVLLPVNLIFLTLGVLLYVYIDPIKEIIVNIGNFNADLSYINANLPVLESFKDLASTNSTDELFPLLALNHFGTLAGIVFLLGIIAAAFSSADSAITALTTAVSIDFAGIDPNDDSRKAKRKRLMVHIGVSATILFIIIIFKQINDSSVIKALFQVASYTYGPLLGMFAFGLFTKRKTNDKYVFYIALAAPVISYLLNAYSQQLFAGYKIGFELLIFNGLLTFIGLWIFSKKQ